MKLTTPKTAALALAFISLLLHASPTLRAQTIHPVTAIATLDSDRISGTWYEIARYPYKKQRQCVADDFEQIALGDKPHRFELVDSCRTKDGYTDVRNLTAKAANKTGGGEFKVSTIWPFSRKYWILAVGSNFEWALLGSPDRKTLWVFSKSITLAPEILAQIEATGAAEGFPANRLVLTPQTQLSQPHPTQVHP